MVFYIKADKNNLNYIIAQGEVEEAKSSPGSCHNFVEIQVMWWHQFQSMHILNNTQGAQTDLNKR